MRRTNDQLQRDRAQTSKLYLQGVKQYEIAEIQGVDQSVISDDLKAIRKQWLASAVRDFDEARAQELAKIDTLEVEYWQAWQRSLKPKKTETAKTSSRPKKANLRNPKAEAEESRRDEASVKEEFRDGDPRFLAGVERCIERRCKLLGLDAPQKLEQTTIDLNDLTDEQLQRVADGESPASVLTTTGTG